MTSPTPSLADLAARYWQFVREERPYAALLAGQPAGDELLRDAPEDHERRARRAVEFLAELQRIDLSALTVRDRATARLLEHELVLLRDAVAIGATWRPSLFPLGPEFLPVFIANTVNLFDLDEAQRWLARLASVPRALDGVTRSLQQGLALGIRYPRLTLERAAGNVRGQVAVSAAQSPLHGPFARAIGRLPALEPLAQESLRIIEQEIFPALTAYAGFIEGPLMAVARDSLACTDDLQGAGFYRHLVRQFATVDESPEAIHALGLAELERLTRDALQVAADAGFPGDLTGFRRHLAQDPGQFAATAEALREEIEVLSKRIDAKLPAFFGHLPRITYGVQSMPEATAERMPPAYAQPNPADNSAPGIHWVSSIPSKLPRYMHVPLALHEAWPGHLMHLALIQEQDHLPEFRRYGALGYSACLEGWALYCERLGEDLGLYDTPQKRYGRIEMEVWRAVRLVVDTGLHARGWSRQQAIDFACSHMAMPLVTIEAEVDRYIAMPGQALAYQLGNIRMRELRARGEQRLGAKFRLRDFHDAVMAAGPVTLPVLDEVIGDWIERTAAGGEASFTRPALADRAAGPG